MHETPANVKKELALKSGNSIEILKGRIKIENIYKNK
jgi:hypothetical protein